MRIFHRIGAFSGAALIVLFAISLAGAKDHVNQTFEKKDRIVIKTVSGDCVVVKGTSDQITVDVVSDYDPEDSFEAVMRESGSTLRLKELIFDSNSGRSTWTISVPDDIEIEFSSASGDFTVTGLRGNFSTSTASGDIELNGCSGRFELSSASGSIDLTECQGDIEGSSASGDVHASKCQGRFELSSASGDVDARSLTIDEESNLGAASGNVYVAVAATPAFDLSVGSASGSAILDYCGNRVKGLITFTAKVHGGEIECPFALEGKERFHRSGEEYVRKTVTKETDTPLIEIGTSSGLAELRP